MTMTAVEMLAMSKALKEKDTTWARAAVVPGTYPVDVVVHLSGDVSVGADTDKAGTSHLLTEEFVILALHMAGCTRERAMQVIETLASEGAAMTPEAAKKARAARVAEFDADGSVRAVFAAIKARVPRVPVAGAVKFAGAVEVVADAATGEERVA